MIVFETERLRVRFFTAADKENYFALSGNYDVMKYIREVKTRVQSDSFLEQIIADATPSIGRWAVEEKDNGKFVGQFAIIPMAEMPEKTQLGYSLTPENWGKGYATELTVEGLKYYRQNNSGIPIHAVTETGNLSSQRVLIKAGFQPAGTIIENEKELLLFIFHL